MAAPLARIHGIKFRPFSRLFSPSTNVFRQIPHCSGRLLSTSSIVRGESTDITSEKVDKGKKISSAMKAYLERAQAHDSFMSEQITEYEIGKRHLANIMGVDPDSFEQNDIDQAIEYLLPSGLFDKRARPMLKHPEDIFPKRKAAEFDIDGRPFHSFFYTGYPNYYMIMHEASMKLDALKVYEDQMWAKGQYSSEDQTGKLMAASSEWISLEELKARTLEKLDEHFYKRFIVLLERILTHPYCVREKEFLNQYRKPLVIVGLTDDIPPLKEAENGRLYSDGQGKRKTATANVRLWSNGSGKVSINGHGLVDFFPEIMDREQVAFPLQFTDNLSSLDVEASVEGGGKTGQAGAIRLATSRALLSFVDEDMVERIRLAGLLTRDPRHKERTKPGQWKARKKFTWKRR